MRRVLIAVVGGCVLLGMLPGTAMAVSPIGIAKIVYSGTPGDVGTLKLVTDDEFGCNLLKQSKPNYLKWLFDDGRDGDTDLKGNIVCRDDKLWLELKSKKNQYEPIRVKRPKDNKSVLKATFSFDLAEFKANHLDVTAKSKDSTSPGCTAVACKDDVGPLKAY